MNRFEKMARMIMKEKQAPLYEALCAMVQGSCHDCPIYKRCAKYGKNEKAIEQWLNEKVTLYRRDKDQNTGLKQFGGNPTEDPELKDAIAETWLRKALYYGLKTSNPFIWLKTWVNIDGVRYDIKIETGEAE